MRISEIIAHILQVLTRGKRMTARASQKAVPKTGWFARDWRLYLMLILPIAFYLIFCYKPMLGIMIAFQKYNPVKGMWGSQFIGYRR